MELTISWLTSDSAQGKTQNGSLKAKQHEFISPSVCCTNKKHLFFWIKHGGDIWSTWGTNTGCHAATSGWIQVRSWGRNWGSRASAVTLQSRRFEATMISFRGIAHQSQVNLHSAISTPDWKPKCNYRGTLLHWQWPVISNEASVKCKAASPSYSLFVFRSFAITWDALCCRIVHHHHQIRIVPVVITH